MSLGPDDAVKSLCHLRQNPSRSSCASHPGRSPPKTRRKALHEQHVQSPVTFRSFPAARAGHCSEYQLLHRRCLHRVVSVPEKVTPDACSHPQNEHHQELTCTVGSGDEDGAGRGHPLRMSPLVGAPTQGRLCRPEVTVAGNAALPAQFRCESKAALKTTI